jgi:CRP-like cAMP-binding protein
VNDTAEELRLERGLFVRALMPSMRGEGAARLAGLLTPRELPEGALLFREGELPEEFFFVVEGRVVMEAEGLPTWTFGERSLVGMVDMTAWRPHRRTCRATRPTRLLVGRSAAWLDLLDDDPVMGEDAIHNFALRLHQLTSELGHLLAPEPFGPDLGLSSPLAIHEKALVLRDSPLLLHASTQSIASLAQVAEELTLDAGEELFARGRAERALYVVASGVIALRFGDEQRLTRVGPQRFLAPAAALSWRLGEYSAQAETHAIVLRIREEEYYDQSDEHPDLTRAAMAYMVLEQEKMMDLRPPVA